MHIPDPETIIFRLRSCYDLSKSKDEFLHFTNPYEILIATILSAQTTDRCVNQVTKVLFSRYPDCASLARAEVEDLEHIIRPTGFFHTKARKIKDACLVLMSEYQGRVPDQMDDLIRLPGVGRKTANIVLNHAFSKTSGIAVDTHVKRLSMRLGLTNHHDPNHIERDLMQLFSPEVWAEINGLFILHGRKICTARKPACERCILADLCKYASLL